MPTNSEQIIDEFVADGWESNPFDKLIPLLKEQRTEALPLALMVIERVPKGGTFFDFLLSHLTEMEFAQLIAAAVEGMVNGSSDALESVVAYASLQFPGLLTPYLRTLFALNPNAGYYYEEWPWRRADDEEIRVLKRIVERDSDASSRNRAWRCLVATRSMSCIEFAGRHFPSEFDFGGGFEAYAHLAGFDISDQTPRCLHTDAAYHIVFPNEYFDRSDQPAWNAHENHPTWTLEGEAAFECKFGGESTARCSNCGGTLHRLIRLERADAIFGIRLPQLDLCTCLSCLGWEAPEIFFSHGKSGISSPLALECGNKNPRFPAEALLATSVSIVRSPPRWENQDWALSNGRENLNRVGGAPSWIQDSEYPRCPRCERLMAFIAQLDSNLPTSDGGEWLWGSGGICYMFWCDSCAISGNLWQCT